MINVLADLKEKCDIKAIKAEFEDEGSSFEDVLKLKKMSDSLNLDVALKIGGCGALNDIGCAKKIGIKTIIAPMVESKYAFQKFIKSAKAIYEKENVDLYVNIETKTGLNSLDEILNSNEAKYLKGIVLGRSDMANSFGFDKEGDSMLDVARYISKKTREYKKEFVIGGGITPKSVKFLSELGEDNFDYFETRKVIFKLSEINNKNLEKVILQALEFEIEWLKNLQNPFRKDYERIKNLEDIVKKIPTNC